MHALPPGLTELMAALGQLPGVGPRTAERLALHLVQADTAFVRALATTLLQTRERIQFCRVCAALTECQPCPICEDPRRDDALLCVVEKAVDVLLVEKSGAFRGRYHVLGGRLSPMNGIGPDDLRLDTLEARLGSGRIHEVVLALPTDVEGDATCDYLARRLSTRPIRISRLAHGLPAGASLEFADELTLSQALAGRQVVETPPNPSPSPAS